MSNYAEQIKANYDRVVQRVTSAAMAGGRDVNDITIVGVTKYVSKELAADLVDAGCTNLGESRPQVLVEKASELPQTSIRWHMIGHLQRNKVGKTLQHASLIHSVDSLRLATAINRLAEQQNKVADILLEVNVSGEEAKHGIGPDQLADLLTQVKELGSLSVNGLMCMAGLGSGESETRQQFATLRQLRDGLADQASEKHSMCELSMGMSGDFELAIAEGATMIRIGSILFEGCNP